MKQETSGVSLGIPGLQAGEKVNVFSKTRMRETAEIERAKVLRKVCEVEHDHARISFIRKVKDNG